MRTVPLLLVLVLCCSCQSAPAPTPGHPIAGLPDPSSRFLKANKPGVVYAAFNQGGRVDLEPSKPLAPKE